MFPAVEIRESIKVTTNSQIKLDKKGEAPLENHTIITMLCKPGAHVAN